MKIKKYTFYFALILAVFFPITGNAAGFYFFPQENKVWNGKNFVIEARLDTDSETTNAVEVLINFPKEDVEKFGYQIISIK